MTLGFLTSFPDGDADPEPPFGNYGSRRIVVFFVILKTTSIFKEVFILKQFQICYKL